jgi:hypothetical protein
MPVLDDHRRSVVRALCEVIVPGSGRVGPETYIDALLARMPPPARDAAIAAIDTLEQPVAGGPAALAQHAFSPEFLMIRALACEAYYSDFVAPGAPGPGAWEEIDFKPPLAARLDKDWSYLGVTG